LRVLLEDPEAPPMTLDQDFDRAIDHFIQRNHRQRQRKKR